MVDTESCLCLADVTVTVGHTTLFTGACCAVPPGDNLAIIGPSGIGKTMLCKAIAGIRHPLVTIDGSITMTPQDGSGRAPRVAWVGQDTRAALNPLQRIGRQLEEPARVVGHSKRDAHQLAVNYLTTMKLADPAGAMSKYPAQLSGGERQRAAIALALASEPDVVIADEPSAALDFDTARAALDALTSASGASLVLVTHDAQLAADTCHHALILSKEAAPRVVPARTLRETSTVSGRESSLGRAVENTAQADSSPATVLLHTTSHMPTTPDTVLECHDVSRTYTSHDGGDVAALDGVTFRVAAGERHAIVGPSGAGKSTLLALLLGRDTPTTGRVTYNNDALVPGRIPREFRRSVQYIPQHADASLNPRRTVEWSIAEPLRLLKVPGDHTRRIAELLDALGLSQKLAKRHPQQLSGGQRQRVAIARALAPNPQILLVDEPTSALDPESAGRVLSALDDARAVTGCGFVVITHDLDAARHLADIVTLLRGGRVVAQGPPSNVLDQPQLIPTHIQPGPIA